MNIRIIRGTHQIGGSAIEITTKKARIFLDFGEELGEEPKELVVDGVNNGTSNCDAVFFSHSHGDHIGLAHTINDDIPLYLGVDAKEIYKIFIKRIGRNSKISLDRVEGIKTYKANEPVIIKDINVTPYYIDHSAYDSYMFLIEADNKKILYTGDFRGHGFFSKALEPMIKKHIGKVDAIIIEGTTLNRSNEKSKTEIEIENEIKKVVDNNKYVYMIVASTNIHRIAGAYQSVKKQGKYFLVDSKYQKEILSYVKEKHTKESSLYDIKKITVYGKNLDEKIKRQGFLMIGGMKKQNLDIIKKFPDIKIIYSMWDGYLDENRISDDARLYRDNYNLIHIHTSGHADRETLKKVIDITNPDKIIPIHTEAREEYKKMAKENKCVIMNDGEVIEI